MTDPTSRHQLRQQQRAEQIGTYGTMRAERADDLESRTKAELEEMAEERGLSVEGTGAGGAVLKSDLVKALS